MRILVALAALLAFYPAHPAAASDPDGTFYLRNAHRGGSADAEFKYGRSGDLPLAGDWNGDGTTTVGVVRDGVFHLRNRNSAGRANVTFSYGRAGDVPLAGDWNGDGRATVGVRRGATWHLRNRTSGGRASATFVYGRPGDTPVVGDWNGDGRSTVGVVRGNTWHLRNSNSAGPANITFTYGRAGDTPIVGNWNGDGRDTAGTVRGSRWLLRNAHRGGAADRAFTYGRAGDAPVAGDWNRSGVATVAAVRQPQPLEAAAPAVATAPVIAHRGASCCAPENTVEAFELAADMDAAMIEFDVRATPDGDLMVMHDEWRGEDVPSLAEVLALDLGVPWLLDAKGPEVLDLLVDALPEGLDVTVQSFSRAALAEFAELRPDVPVWALRSGRPSVSEVEWWTSFAEGAALRHSYLDSATVTRLQTAGLDVAAWTVNDAGDARRLAGYGVDWVITDHPDLFR